MANRTRDIQVKFRVTQEELDFITLKCSNWAHGTGKPICAKWL